MLGHHTSWLSLATVDYLWSAIPTMKFVHLQTILSRRHSGKRKFSQNKGFPTVKGFTMVGCTILIIFVNGSLTHFLSTNLPVKRPSIYKVMFRHTSPDYMSMNTEVSIPFLLLQTTTRAFYSLYCSLLKVGSFN